MTWTTIHYNPKIRSKYEAMTHKDFSSLIDCEMNDTKTNNFLHSIERHGSFCSNDKSGYIIIGFEANDINTGKNL